MPPGAPDDELFATPWVHVFEEDSPEGLVFRPEGADIPLSRRPRLRLSFSRDGSARTLRPGPDDRPVEREATWRSEGGGLVLRTTGGPGREKEDVQIVEVSKGRLVVKR